MMKTYSFLIDFDQNFITNFINNPIRCPGNLTRFNLVGFPNVKIFTSDRYNPINPNNTHLVEFKPILNFTDNDRYQLDYLYMKISPFTKPTSDKAIPAIFSFHFKRLPFISNDTNNINFTGMRKDIIIFNMSNYYYSSKQSKSSLKLSLLYFYFELSINKDNLEQYLLIKKDIDSSFNDYIINASNPSSKESINARK